MLKKAMYLSVSGGILISTLFASGCASTYTMVAPTPPPKYKIIGPTTGSATGSLGIIATAYNFVPIALNDRVQRAYNNALNNAPGATGLIDVTYEEDWYWWLIGTARNVTVKGIAIKEIPQ